MGKCAVIAILNQKGGCGKTTLATNLATGLHRQGLRVLLVDSDPQGSARDWKAAGESPVPVVGLDRKTLAADLPAISGGYDAVVIDGAPQIREMAAAAVKAATVVLVPVQPSPYDIWAASDLVELIKARQEVTDGQPRAAFVVSRAIKHTKLSGEVREALGEFGLDVFQCGTTQRVAYTTSAAQGVSVFDTEDASAIEEINTIIAELDAWL